MKSALADNAQPYVDTALAGELQFPGHVYSARGVSRFPTDELDPATMFLAGFDRLVVGPDFDPRSSAGLLFTEWVFDGSTRLQRIVRSPQVTVYGLAEMLTESDAVRSRVDENPRFALTPPTFVGPVPSAPGDDWICDPPRPFAEPAGSSQDHCWTHSRITHLLVDSRAVQAAVGTSREIEVTLDIMSPWPNQSCSLALAEWTSPDLCAGLQVRMWEHRTASLPSALLAGAQGLTLVARHVHSPASQGIAEDERRWGLAIRAVGLAGRDR